MSWTVTKWSGSSFASDGSLKNPIDIEVGTVSRAQRDVLADGSEGVVIPTVKSWLSIHFAWSWLTTAEKDKLKGYVDNANIVTLTDLLSQAYIGEFIDVKWKETGGPIYYDVTAEFRQATDPST